jgi:hypothetical protein
MDARGEDLMRKPREYVDVHMLLSGCEFGMIDMTLGTPTQEVRIRLTTCYDPIPSFIRWMEALLTDVMDCGFGIEEEGPEKYIFTRTQWDGRYLLTVSESDINNTKVYLKDTIHRRQLIGTIYRGLQAFGKSPEYVSDEWAHETLGERIRKLTSKDIPDVCEFLLRQDRATVDLFFHAVFPTLHSRTPSRQDENMKSLEAMLGFARIPGNPVVEESRRQLEEYRESAIVRPEGDREFILSFLDQQCSIHDGTPLDTLRSDVLEQYLASDRDDLPS